MHGLSEKVQGHVLRIQVRLFACRERLLAGTDGEALHDLADRTARGSDV